MIVNGSSIVCQVDSGASVNVISANHVHNVRLDKVKTKLSMYNGSTLKARGKAQLVLKNPKNGKKFKAEFVVVDENLMTLIGKKTSEDMKLITVNYDNFESVSKVDDGADPLLSDFADVFGDDQGNLPGIAHFQVDDSAIPVISPSCRVPHAMKSQVEAEL